MTIREMHYDFKFKFNKLDSQQNRNLLIPEIDWVLNEAILLYVKMITQPRAKSYLGFEINQRSIDDIRTLVVNNLCSSVINNIVTLPQDYLFFVNANVTVSKEGCSNTKARFHLRQHDDEFELSPFDKSSFEWRVVNGVFFENGIRLFTDGTFSNNEFCMSYIKKPVYVYNAQDFGSATYRTLDGINLTGFANCDLPEHTHPEIVDLAVALASSNIATPEYQLKMNKLSSNQLK